jgi:prepilin-type N-terminal cleavage/methylation domain-containing protein
MATDFRKRLSKRCARGFSLIELLIVVAILGIISAIAVPNLIRAREAARYSWFQATARSIGSSLEIYAIANKNRYPIDGINFGPPGQNATKWRSDSGMEWIGTSDAAQEPSWKIDYEVHPNGCPGGSGTSYIAVVFQGIRNPSPATIISGNCTYRSAYGRGEAIPNEDGRIFVLNEFVTSDRLCLDSNCN